MTKDTKEIIVRSLLNIASENGKINIEEIAKRSHITRTTITNNFKNRVPSIVE
nr:TetR/AcrR family transcriptional regulator [Lactococcus cremoris]